MKSYGESGAKIAMKFSRSHHRRISNSPICLGFVSHFEGQSTRTRIHIRNHRVHIFLEMKQG